MGAVGDNAPKRLVLVIEVVLKGERRGARPVDGQSRTATVKRLGRGHHDERNATACDQGDGCLSSRQIIVSEGFIEEARNKAPCGILSWCLDLGEGIEVRLSDAESCRDFFADREALSNG